MSVSTCISVWGARCRAAVPCHSRPCAEFRDAPPGSHPSERSSENKSNREEEGQNGELGRLATWRKAAHVARRREPPYPWAELRFCPQKRKRALGPGSPHPHLSSSLFPLTSPDLLLFRSSYSIISVSVLSPLLRLSLPFLPPRKSFFIPSFPLEASRILPLFPAVGFRALRSRPRARRWVAGGGSVSSLPSD